MQYIRFDSVGGASGDMLLAAFSALGADLQSIERTLRRCLPERVSLQVAAAADSGLHGCRVCVRGAGHAEHVAHWPDAGTQHAGQDAGAHNKPHPRHENTHKSRTLRDVDALLRSPALDASTRRLAHAVFHRLAVAEGRIHGRRPGQVHFHEIGAIDSIADIVGCCLALQQLNVAGVTIGPLPCGVGVIRCAHGAMPNPAPATMDLLAGFDVLQTDEPFELVTPTAAALLATWRETLATPPANLRVVRSGLGFGVRQLRNRPNVLRATLLESSNDQNELPDPPDLLVLETNLDDCNPQWIGELVPRLLAAGALDAWSTPATMKKGRPGLVLAALVPAAKMQPVADLIFRATTTFGIRFHAVQREVLDRRFETAKTPFGAVRVKIGSRRGEDLVRAPEFEDCARQARLGSTTPRQVHEAALQAAPAAGRLNERRAAKPSVVKRIAHKDHHER